MRRGLFFMLMVVLVLRGLTGTAMAAGLLPPLMPTGVHSVLAQAGHTHGNAADVDAAAAVVAVAAADTDDSDHHHGHQTGPAGHPSQAAAPSCDGAAGACGAQGHHASTCSACDICHSAVLAPSAPLAHAAIPRGHTRPLASAPFHSAPAALAIKPPIA